MSAVHPMKLSPLVRGERPKDGVLGNRLTSSVFGITSRDDVPHASDVFKDFTSELRDGCTSRQRPLGRFAAGRKISKPDSQAALPALSVSIYARPRFTRGQATLAILYCAQVGQIQVVQYFGRTPFALGMAS